MIWAYVCVFQALGTIKPNHGNDRDFKEEERGWKTEFELRIFEKGQTDGFKNDMGFDLIRRPWPQKDSFTMLPTRDHWSCPFPSSRESNPWVMVTYTLCNFWGTWRLTLGGYQFCGSMCSVHFGHDRIICREETDFSKFLICEPTFDTCRSLTQLFLCSDMYLIINPQVITWWDCNNHCRQPRTRFHGLSSSDTPIVAMILTEPLLRFFFLVYTSRHA